MKRSILLVLFTTIAVALFAQSEIKIRLAPNTPKSRIVNMDPAKVDPSDLPLDRVDQLHPTGTPQKIQDISTWRLVVTGKALKRPLSLSYIDLLALPIVRKKVLLICPGVFADFVEWEGAPLSIFLERVEARSDFTTVSFTGYDGYIEKFSREEATKHQLFLATKVNGQTLTPTAGYPIRLVAEDFFGGRWVKWIKEIQVE
jgi:sulfoxide reductase catalytic subunit YedY